MSEHIKQLSGNIRQLSWNTQIVSEEMPVERHLITSRKDWLELRKPDVTASVGAALFGAHPYLTRLKLYYMHQGLEFGDPDDAVLRRGHIMEPAVKKAIQLDRPGLQLTANDPDDGGYYYRDPELRLGATPDYHFVDEDGRKGVLQAKSAAPHVFARDWDEGKTIPFWIVTQTLIEAMLTDAEYGLVAVLKVDAFDTPCPILTVPRHEQAERRIVAEVKRFWDDIKHGREPPADYGRDSELLAYLAPRGERGKMVDLSGDNQLPELLDEREQLKETIKGAKNRCDEIETEVKFKMRDATRAIIPGWKISWADQHRNEFVMPAKDIRVLRIDRRE